MPLPDVPPPTTAGSIGRHVFVSYSHKDAALVEPFMSALYALAGNAPELGLARERIFFDSERIRAGDDWDATIESHLLRADVFLLLVSNQCLTSQYCVTKELSGAARRGIPVVPVLLSPTASWKTRPVDGDPQQRLLGALNAVPLLGSTGPQAIHGGGWATVELACTAAADQLCERLRRDDAPPPLQAQAAQRQAHPRLDALLPYLCNQQPPADSFDDGLEAWPAGHALLVLVKGEYADDTPGFWDRMRARNLPPSVHRRGGQALTPKRPLELPKAQVEGRLQEGLPRIVRRALSEALFDGDRGALLSGDDLAAVLQKATGVVPLEATLGAEDLAGCALVLQALLDLLDSTPPDALLGRLVLAVLVEDPALVALPDLAGSLRLRAPTRRTHVIETRRLIALTGDDVKRWHRNNGLGTALRLDEEALVQRLFKGAATLRHRPFTQEVQPLLGLVAKDPDR